MVSGSDSNRLDLKFAQAVIIVELILVKYIGAASWSKPTNFGEVPASSLPTKDDKVAKCHQNNNFNDVFHNNTYFGLSNIAYIQLNKPTFLDNYNYYRSS